MGKIRFFGILFIGSILIMMFSCLGGNNIENEEWNFANAQISSFALESDEYDLSEVKFTIDQLNSKIYNKDSLPYGTVIENKLIATVGFDSPFGVSSLFFIEMSTGDTVQSVADSIDFSEPVMITVNAFDGISTKTYEAKLNIHQVNPNLLVWEEYGEIIPEKIFQDMKMLLFAGDYYMYLVENGVYKLYRSDVAAVASWEKLDLSGFPEHAILSQLTEFEQVLYVITEAGELFYAEDGQAWMQASGEWPLKSLLGNLPADTISGRAAVLCCIADIDGILHFATIDKTFNCTQGQAVPATFPLSGFGQFSYATRYYPRLVVATGRDMENNLSNMAWATMNGITWASLSNPNVSFPAREDASVVFYDNCFFVIGGYGLYGQGLRDIYFSIDQGVTWLHDYYVLKEREEDEEDEEDTGDEYVLREYYPMPDEFESRGSMTVITDKNNYLWLFGGKAGKDTNCLNEIWQGRINRLGFGKD